MPGRKEAFRSTIGSDSLCDSFSVTQSQSEISKELFPPKKYEVNKKRERK